ncbi:hypothetical protein OIO90_004308 [Microbotryomycetes sp. JL221]|nr:hypothetical protein OIO90_004308 [Microbotryomycetes sp. JL221]
MPRDETTPLLSGNKTTAVGTQNAVTAARDDTVDARRDNNADQSRPLTKAVNGAPQAANGNGSNRYQSIDQQGDRETSLDSSDDDDDDDDESVEAEQRTTSRSSIIKWTLFWIAVAVLVIALVVQAFKRGGGQFDWRGALKKAGGGGVAGALAMVIQVLSLMWIRTIMNYQYRYGGTLTQSTKKLYAEGGIGRFYSGVGPALIQGPIARFGDTAANAGILALLASNPFLNKLPSPLKTAFASVAGALFRMVLMPIDTLKTTMQTQGRPGLSILKQRIKLYGPGTLWSGAWATAAANFVGSFPWFATYNALQANLPPAHTPAQKILRQAVIGFCASVVSDTISNSLRVVKTYRQVNKRKVSYTKAARRIIRREGYKGLFGRGLKTRILANGLQGIMFSVLWKLIQDAIEKKKQ